MSFKFAQTGLIILFLFSTVLTQATDIQITNNSAEKNVVFGNSKLMLALDYNNKCSVSKLTVNGQAVITRNNGIF